MADSKKPHLRLRKTAISRSYQVVSTGGGGKKGPFYPARSRSHHGAALIGGLDSLAAREKAIDATRASVGLEADGTTVAVEISLNPDFNVGSLENSTAGVELLAIHKLSANDSVAAVYVPRGKLDNTRRKVEHYLDPTKDTPAGAPRNAPLVASIEGFRAPTAEDLWTDSAEPFPVDSHATHWWELWLRGAEGLETFREQARRLGVDVGPQQLAFPERTVVAATGTIEAIERVVELLDAVAEIRAAPPLDAHFHKMDAVEQGEWVDDLANRVLPPDDDDHAVCLLDTGVAWGHSLLSSVISPDDCLGYADWDRADTHGHGTQMAGIAVFGEELASALESSEEYRVPFVLESVNVFNPGKGHVPPKVERLLGEIFLTAVASIEIVNPHRTRTFSFTITRDGSREGKPTSWSSAIDGSCAGVDGAPPRLVFSSAGNILLTPGYLYPEDNYTSTVQDPAQAWNAITVGAMTRRVEFDRSPTTGRMGWKAVAPLGDLSPDSSTSRMWDAKQWPSKPDFVMEGGNAAVPPSGGQPRNVDELELLTTARPAIAQSPLTTARGTSPAAVLAARLATEVWRAYPEFWPETIRALLVHSCRWTKEMRERCSVGTPREQAQTLLRTFGYGVPSRDRALFSAGNALTMVVEDTIRPYKLVDTGGAAETNKAGKKKAKTNELRLHRLPWPEDALEELGDLGVNVRLRVTLSYYVEPSPGERGWSGRYRYASHGLRFAVRTADESDTRFEKRINKAARAEGETGFRSDAREWVIGPDKLSTGSIHSDVWSGPAEKLSGRGLIAVYPVIGWWRERQHLGQVERDARYSLVVSLETDETEVTIEGESLPVDLYTEVANEVEVAAEIDV